jgi:hypothetical protein
VAPSVGPSSVGPLGHWQRVGWTHHLDALATYRAEHGHAAPPARYRAADGFRLGQWVWALRHQRRRGGLTLERIAVLDALGFVWSPRRQSVADAVAVVVGPPVRLTGEVAQFLRRAGRKNRLSPEDSAALAAVGFVWWLPGPVRSFTYGLAALDRYLAAHGKLPAHQTRTADGYGLGNWLAYRLHQHRRGLLPADQAAALLTRIRA